MYSFSCEGHEPVGCIRLSIIRRMFRPRLTRKAKTARTEFCRETTWSFAFGIFLSCSPNCNVSLSCRRCFSLTYCRIMDEGAAAIAHAVQGHSFLSHLKCVKSPWATAVTYRVSHGNILAHGSALYKRETAVYGVFVCSDIRHILICAVHVLACAYTPWSVHHVPITETCRGFATSASDSKEGYYWILPAVFPNVTQSFGLPFSNQNCTLYISTRDERLQTRIIIVVLTQPQEQHCPRAGCLCLSRRSKDQYRRSGTHVSKSDLCCLPGSGSSEKTITPKTVS